MPKKGVLFGKCPECSELIVYLVDIEHPDAPPPHGGYPTFSNLRMVQPKTINRPPLSPDIPEDFAADYREACLVLDDSPKAAAALARRCLQHIIRAQAGITKRTLDQEIEALLDANSLPAYLSKDLDAIRHLGNIATHPLKTEATGEIVDVDPQEAEWTLNIIEGLFDFYFVQPAVAEQKRQALNAKLAAAGKPPLKTP